MNKYNKLMDRISQRLCLEAGSTETEDEFKARVIYSVCGMMAYTALWDETEEETLSIIHVKNRIKEIFLSYKELYPESVSELPDDSEKLEDEIIELFLKNGIVYHTPNRITSAVYTSAYCEGVLFQRGVLPDEIQKVSGIGLYDIGNAEESAKSLSEMFALDKIKLSDAWGKIVSIAKWSRKEVGEIRAEFLRTKPPYSKGYWENNADTSGSISIMRTGMPGNRIYFLYKYSNGEMETSPIPVWMVENYNYRSLLCACLKSLGTLPSIEYEYDGALAYVNLRYLLPPRELNLLKLYSWPKSCVSLPSDFNRKCARTVFDALKSLLEQEGYLFEERKR